MHLSADIFLYEPVFIGSIFTSILLYLHSWNQMKKTLCTENEISKEKKNLINVMSQKAGCVRNKNNNHGQSSTYKTVSKISINVLIVYIKLLFYNSTSNCSTEKILFKITQAYGMIYDSFSKYSQGCMQFPGSSFALSISYMFHDQLINWTKNSFKPKELLL